MRVIQVPGRLGLVAALVMLCIPLVAVEIIIATRAPYWDLPYRTIRLWCGAVAVVLVPLSIWMAYGRQWALRVTGLFAVVWCAVSAYLAISMRNFWLGIFDLFLILFWIVLWFWLRHEMGRSFFDPKVKWFQGAPKSIPGLSCEVIYRDRRGEKKFKKVQFKVSRLDRDGAFLFKRGTESSLPPRIRAKLNFYFGGQKMSCRGLPVRILDRLQTNTTGIGYRFSGMSRDESKNMLDFVESLRSVGYA